MTNDKIPKNGEIIIVKYKFVEDAEESECRYCVFNVENECCSKPYKRGCSDNNTQGHYEFVEDYYGSY